MDNREYYQNLLIIQYHDKPNAKATIGAMYDIVVPKNSITGNYLITDIGNAFNLDTAVGVQLDIIGQYIGADRFYKGQNLSGINKFGLDDYTGFSEATLGFNSYSTYNNDVSSGSLVYSDLISVTNKLSDDDYRFLLKLKAAQNNCDYSCASIDNILYTFFGEELFYIDNKNMTITYFVSQSRIKLLPVLVQKDILLRPMGVGIESIIKQNIYFGLTSYNSPIPEWETGFSTYSNFSTDAGVSLTYNDLIEV